MCWLLPFPITAGSYPLLLCRISNGLAPLFFQILDGPSELSLCLPKPGRVMHNLPCLLLPGEKKCGNQNGNSEEKRRVLKSARPTKGV